jgi:hypothetical protein
VWIFWALILIFPCSSDKGPVALIGFPGEPFTDIGVAVKEAPGWELILPCALTNGNEGYFPMQSAYDEGGYESRTSRYKAASRSC